MQYSYKNMTSLSALAKTNQLTLAVALLVSLDYIIYSKLAFNAYDSGLNADE